MIAIMGNPACLRTVWRFLLAQETDTQRERMFWRIPRSLQQTMAHLDPQMSPFMFTWLGCFWCWGITITAALSLSPGLGLLPMSKTDCCGGDVGLSPRGQGDPVVGAR